MFNQFKYHNIIYIYIVSLPIYLPLCYLESTVYGIRTTQPASKQIEGAWNEHALRTKDTSDSRGKAFGSCSSKCVHNNLNYVEKILH